MTQTASRAIALLSAAGIGGLCAASLAPPVDCAGVVSDGSAGTARSAARDQELCRERHQRALYSSGGSKRRQRPASLQQDGERYESQADDVGFGQQKQGMFNSFSLEEQEPSCYFRTRTPLRSAQHQQQQQQQQQEQGRDAIASTGGYPATSDSQMDREYHSNDTPFYNAGENYAEIGTDGPPTGHYYPGRGRNAAESLLVSGRDLAHPKNNAAPSSSSYLRHRHQPYVLNGGNPYSSSSSSMGRSAAGAVVRRRRRPSSDSTSPFPILSPAVRANAAAAATALVKVASAAALILSVLVPLAAALSSHWAYFVAGGICAAVSHTAAVPLDVIKTRIQCAPPGVKYRGTWDALVRICRSEGTRVLFCGAGATLVGYALQGSLKFGFFEFLKPVFAGLFLRRGSAAAATAAATAAAAAPALGTLIAASVTAEIAGSSALTPLEAARIRMVADANYATGLRSGITRMISEEGVGALTRGLPAVLAKQVPYTVTKLVTFDYLVRSVASRFSTNGGGGVGSGKGRSTGVGVTVACAVVAGVLSSLASQPGDSLLSALNSEGRGDKGGNGADAASSSELSDYNSEDGSSSGSDSEDLDGGVYFQSEAGPVGGGMDAWQQQEHQVQLQRQQQVEPVARAMLRIAREAGFSGLFRGTGARMMHVTSIVTVQLLIYQSIKGMVGIAS